MNVVEGMEGKVYHIFFRNRKWISYITGGMLIAAFIITRFWHVTSIPKGMHIDEIGMAYDAWSLSQYGFDRYLKSWPVYLNNFGSGQSSLYCYLCAGLFRLFGYHMILVRLPGIFSSFLLLIFGVLLADKIFYNNRMLSYLVGALLVVCPYFIMASRFGLDCNLMLGFSTMFLYFFTCAIEREQHCWYFLAGISGGIVLYTYAISYIVLPIYLLLSLLYIIRMGKFRFSHWFIMMLPMGILAFPLVLVQIINIFELPEMTLGCFTIIRLYPYRGSEISIPELGKLLHTLKSIFIGDDLNYNSIPGFANLYLITPPLFCLGIAHSIGMVIKSVRNKERKIITFPLLWFICMLSVGAMIEAGCNRINGIFYTVILLTVNGVYVLCRALMKYTIIIVTGFLTLYCVCFLSFGKYYYFGNYCAEHYPLDYFQITVSEAIDYLNKNPQYQNKGTHMAQPGICFALSSLLSPVEIEPVEEIGVYQNYYYTGGLGEIEEGFNYIVTDIYQEYAEQLRKLGYTEKQYQGYSLFYQENQQK